LQTFSFVPAKLLLSCQSVRQSAQNRYFRFMKHYDVCMTIAGSDPSGGAGIQADLKVFTTLECYGEAVVSALTVQNTRGVKRSVPVEAQLLYEQIDAVMQDLMPRAVKIGILPSSESVRAVARALSKYKPQFVVLDPVMVSTSGLQLMDDEAIQTLKTELIPLCSLVTPNLVEAERLAEQQSSPEDLARTLYSALGNTPFLIKGGHRADSPTDILYDGEPHFYQDAWQQTRNTHGTGCVLSSAIAAYLARGFMLAKAVELAKHFLSVSLKLGADYAAGSGAGAMFLLPR